MKAKACHYGFHLIDDDGILTGDFKEGKLAYQGRKKSRYYSDSFESLIVTEEGDICTYCFCCVNSYDWRRKVYNAAGFETEDSIGFWYKKCNYELYLKKQLDLE